MADLSSELPKANKPWHVELSNQDPTNQYSATTVLPVFPSAAEAVAQARDDSTAATPIQVLINNTHYLEVSASPTVFDPATIDGTQPPVVTDAAVTVRHYRDVSNKVGQALGTEGVSAIRAMGGPAMEMILICLVLMLGAACCAFGFTICGVLLTMTCQLLCPVMSQHDLVVSPARGQLDSASSAIGRHGEVLSMILRHHVARDCFRLFSHPRTCACHMLETPSCLPPKQPSGSPQAPQVPVTQGIT